MMAVHFFLLMLFFSGAIVEAGKTGKETETIRKNDKKNKMRLAKGHQSPTSTGNEVDLPSDLSAERTGRSSLNHLLQVIFDEYHKELVPKRPTIVRLDLLLIKVKSTNEREGIFESVVALFIGWKDERITWNPQKYDNTTVLAFDSDKVWLPDIAMTNSADHLYSISKDTRFVVRVSHDGAMKFVPTGTSSYEFESWSLDSSTMTFNTSSEALVDDAFSSPQWALCKHQATVYDYLYEFSGEHFTRVRFDFVVRRKTTFYVINLIFPTTTLSLIQLLVFAIPSTDATSDRISFGTTNLLTLVVFQTIITEEMPKSSDSVTALSKYIIALIVISAVGILESVAAERLLRSTTTPPPRWLIKYCRLPLLWDSQLPTNIAQMILSSWGRVKQEEQQQRIVQREVQQKNGNNNDKKPSIVIEYEDDFDNSKQHSACCFRRKKAKPIRRNSVLSQQSWMSPKTRIVIMDGNSNDSTTGGDNSHHYEQLANARSAPVPKKSTADETDFDDYVNLHSRKQYNINHMTSHHYAPSTSSRLSNAYYGVGRNNELIILPRNNGDANKPNNNNNNGNNNSAIIRRQSMTTPDELQLIQIGKEWGAIVTRLDGLTFVICASSAIILPIVLFVPLALVEGQCSANAHGS